MHSDNGLQRTFYGEVPVVHGGFFLFKQQLSSSIPRIINYKWNLQEIILSCFVCFAFKVPCTMSLGAPLTHSWALGWRSVYWKGPFTEILLSLLPCTQQKCDSGSI